jgi:tetratricopeptide (TPR) repeat protein
VVDSLLKSGIRNIINQKYSAATDIFSQLDEEFPELPFGKIYLAASKIAHAYDYAEEYDADFIESNLEEARDRANELLASDENNLWFNYYYALAEGYIAYFDAINDNWISAISTGMNSISAFGNCLNLDKNFYEAYIAIGTYEYWKSRRTEFLNGLPFYEDDSEIGMDRLRTAVDLSSYNSYLATNSLIWIYIDQNDFNRAIELGEKAVSEFPESRYFKWGLARAYEDVNPRTALEKYYEILNSFPQSRDQNNINKIILKHLIAQQYLKTGEKEKALELCEEILSINNFTEFELSKLDNRLKRVSELKNSLNQ